MKPQKKAKKPKAKVLQSYITSTISITLVLFLVGLMSLLMLNANRLSEYIQEHIGFTLVLHDDVKESEVLRLQKQLSSTSYVKESEYVDKDTAAKKLSAELGEDFVDFLGFNPLFSSVDIKVYADYMQEDSLLVLEKAFIEYPQVKDVFYQRDLVKVINSNVRKITLFLLTFTLLLVFIFTALINNAVRLLMYNQRFLINTMKLVGATHEFIRKPFMRQSIISSIIGALLANLAMMGLVLSYESNLNIAFEINTLSSTVITFSIIVIFGIVISSISTYFAVNKYLRMKYEELF